MKHIYNTQEVYHIAFHRPEGLYEARNSTNNVSWRYIKETNKTIFYSYSSELAIVDHNNKIIYFRNGSYSNTTSKHQNYFYNSISDKTIYTIIYFNNWWDWMDFDKWCNSELQYCINDKHKLYKGIKYFSVLNIHIQKWEYYKEILLIINRQDLINKYEPLFKQLDWTDDEITMYNVKNWALNNGMLGSYNKKFKYYNDPILKKGVEDKHIANESDKQIALQEKLRKDTEKQLELLELWLNNINNFSSYYLDKIPIHLRINKNEVETTMGARVPVDEAKLLFTKFKKCVNNNINWYTNDEKIKVGLYSVEKIYCEFDGYWYIKAGCHTIRDVEIYKFIEQYKLDW